MKKCSYCGRDNTDEALHCKECGTEFERDPEPENNGLYDEATTVTIRTFTSHVAANIARSNLEAHGIQCWINSDDGGGTMPYLTAPGGVRLLVRVSDVEAATVLLNVETSDQGDKEAGVPSATTPENKNSFVPVAIMGGVVVLLFLLFLSAGKDKPGTKTAYHYASNGKADEAWIYQKGHLIEYQRDRNKDGKWDEWDYYEHDYRVRSELDNNFDGKVDEWWTFSDDGADTLQRDTDFNGIPDEFCVYRNGIIQQGEMKPNGSKFATEREVFSKGVLAEIWRGGDSNGIFKEVVRYDPFYEPISTNANLFHALSPSSK